jgi:hypothetical protein
MPVDDSEIHQLASARPALGPRPARLRLRWLLPRGNDGRTRRSNRHGAEAHRCPRAGRGYGKWIYRSTLRAAYQSPSALTTAASAPGGQLPGRGGDRLTDDPARAMRFFKQDLATTGVVLPAHACYRSHKCCEMYHAL